MREADPGLKRRDYEDESLDEDKGAVVHCPITLDVLAKDNKTSEDIKKVFAKKLKYR